MKRYIYASSCSVYGYTENDFTMRRAVGSCYPYGISKLQGEQAVMQLADGEFSVISLRKGTISGYSPRMRLRLDCQHHVQTAMRDRIIKVNNPSIWRPILSIEDATTAYIRAVEANRRISGIFNIASGNYTVGEVADLIKSAVEERLNIKSMSHPACTGFPQLQGERRESGQRAELSFHRKCEIDRHQFDRQQGTVPRLGQPELFQYSDLQAC